MLRLIAEYAATIAAAGWWEKTKDSASEWLVAADLYTVISIGYAFVGIVALVQTILIQLRVPEFGWTIQKLFHFLNFIVCGARVLTFGFHSRVLALKPRVFAVAVLEFPGLLFLTAYTLLVLFWAQVYYQARGSPWIRTIRPAYIIVNGLIYVTKFCIWVFMWSVGHNVVLEVMGSLFVAVISFVAALGFLVFGGRLFLMLRWFPLDERRRSKKLREVTCVITICFASFLIRSGFVAVAQLGIVKIHPILELVFYALVEIVPAGLVLFILHELPPRRMPSLYHPLRRP